MKGEDKMSDEQKVVHITGESPSENVNIALKRLVEGQKRLSEAVSDTLPIVASICANSGLSHNQSLILLLDEYAQSAAMIAKHIRALNFSLRSEISGSPNDAS